MRKNLGVWAVLALVVIPILLWLGMLPLSERFGNFYLVARSIGQLTGLTGLTLFAINLILSARLRFLENYFWGLNRIYLKHHLIGGITFMLLLAHPVFLALDYLSFSAFEAAKFLLPQMSRLDILWGEIALLLMMVLLILTFFAPLAYHVWKNTHKFLSLAFAVALVHVLLVSSDITLNPVLKFYLLALMLLALASVVWRKILGKFFFYTLEEVNRFGDRVVELVLWPVGQPMDFAPGQFAFLSVRSFSFSPEEHPFSLTSVPGQEDLKFLIKFSGDYTNQLAKLKAGVGVRVEGPYGRFSFRHYPPGKQIWIAGGIGITPFLSMARSWSDQSHYAVHLYYSGKIKKELVFLEELAKIAEKGSHFKLFPFLSSQKGHLTADYIQEKSAGLKNKEIFICGPKAMMDDLRKQFLELGVGPERIHTEEFAL